MRTSFKNDAGEAVACGTIDPLPGSSQVCVFHSAFVLPHLRNEGIGSAAHADRLRLAKEALYDYAICTVDETNTYQIRNLHKFGWNHIGQFPSSKTKHHVLIFGKNL